ncbi:hypothetical protein ACQP2P_07740 [Dactylosporangium sp. CA-139114]|uniref:hypothetical protein n=1 Tax=Dactylosporangium sp. CA-139114 TaxID=3239931 RepID=UPI003D98AA6E
MRRVLMAVVALSAALVAGCDDAGASPVAPPPTAPAAAAGGACQLLDFGMVNAKLGLNLSVAAGASMDNSFSCVLQTAAGSYPDLVLSVTTTTIGADVFSSAIAPKDGQAVPGLGLVAYQRPTPAAEKSGADAEKSGPGAEKSGPGVEVGWLAGNKRIIKLALRLAPEAGDEQAAADMPKMVELAKLIDLSSL